MSQSSKLINRPDTLFGVCEAIGQDFGFNPLYLRVALAVSLLWNPVAIFALYGALGIAVMVSRLIAPNRVVTRSTAQATTLTAIEGGNDQVPAPVAVAA